MITLHAKTGIARTSGYDHKGNHFVEFTVDHFADQEDGECAQCGRAIDQGWMCIDSGEEYCWDHIRFCLSPEQCAQCTKWWEHELHEVYGVTDETCAKYLATN